MRRQAAAVCHALSTRSCHRLNPAAPTAPLQAAWSLCLRKGWRRQPSSCFRATQRCGTGPRGTNSACECIPLFVAGALTEDKYLVKQKGPPVRAAEGGAERVGAGVAHRTTTAELQACLPPSGHAVQPCSLWRASIYGAYPGIGPTNLRTRWVCPALPCSFELQITTARLLDQFGGPYDMGPDEYFGAELRSDAELASDEDAEPTGLS